MYFCVSLYLLLICASTKKTRSMPDSQQSNLCCSFAASRLTYKTKKKKQSHQAHLKSKWFKINFYHIFQATSFPGLHVCHLFTLRCISGLHVYAPGGALSVAWAEGTTKPEAVWSHNKQSVGAKWFITFIKLNCVGYLEGSLCSTMQDIPSKLGFTVFQPFSGGHCMYRDSRSGQI